MFNFTPEQEELFEIMAFYNELEPERSSAPEEDKNEKSDFNVLLENNG